MKTRLLLLVLIAVLCGCAAPPATSAVPATATLPLNLNSTPFPTSMECVLVSIKPTPGPTEALLYPEITARDWTLGPADAAMTFLEYTDLQSPAAPALDLALANLAEKYPQQMRRVFRHFPLPTSDKGLAAAAAAEAAGAQGKFWEMNRLLMERQEEWSALDAAGFRAWLLEQAATLGLDATAFESALDDPATKKRLLDAQDFGLKAAIPVMPWLLINGRIYQGPRDQRSLESLLTLAVLEQKQFTECPPLEIRPDRQYFARLQTARGEIVAQLYPLEAPYAVNNFVFLARQGWYDGIPFYRVIPGYVAQSGDPSGSGLGTPGYAFSDDYNNLRFDQPGRLAMASAGPNSNGSQFFFTFEAAPDLDGRHVIFGQIIEGLDVLTQLTARDPSSAAELPDADVIQSITIEER